MGNEGIGQSPPQGLSAVCVGTKFVAPPPSWRQQFRPDKEEGRGRPSSSFPLTVSHFETDSGNLTLHLQEKLAHLREARAPSRSWQAQDKQAGDEVEPRGKASEDYPSTK